MFDDNFLNGNSIIHRLDPRGKTLIAFLYSIVVALSNRFPALLFAFFVSLIFVFLAGLSIRKIFFRLLIVNTIILFLWLVIPFTYKGEPLFNLGPVTATKEGVIFAAVITLRSNTILLILISLVGTMSVFTAGRSMKQLGLPLKAVHLFLFTYRYIHSIYREYLCLMNSIKIRGFLPGTNMHTYRTLAYLVGMIFVKSHDRAERVRNAMLCRGFQGKLYDLVEFTLRPVDLAVMAVMMLALTGIGLLQWTTIIY